MMLITTNPIAGAKETVSKHCLLQQDFTFPSFNGLSWNFPLAEVLQAHLEELNWLVDVERSDADWPCDAVGSPGTNPAPHTNVIRPYSTPWISPHSEPLPQVFQVLRTRSRTNLFPACHLTRGRSSRTTRTPHNFIAPICPTHSSLILSRLSRSHL